MRISLIMMLILVSSCDDGAAPLDMGADLAGDGTFNCSNGRKDGRESDIDCGGGICAGCSFGKQCAANADCLSGVCANGACTYPLSCGNGKLDGSETDLDCGGNCPGCADGSRCAVDRDCSSGECVGQHCKPAKPFSLLFAAPQQILTAETWGACDGDFNGDGAVDLATAAQYNKEPSLVILLGASALTFAAPVAYPLAGTGPAWGVFCRDLDGDGQLDVVVGSQSSGAINVFRGVGDGTFKQAESLSVQSGGFLLGVQDLNSDGKPDILASSKTTQGCQLGLLAGDGAGGFSAPITSPRLPGCPLFARVTDLDEDKKFDVVTAAGGFVSVLLNDAGRLGNPANYAISASMQVDVADYNADGHTDLVTASSGSDGVVSIAVLAGNGHGSVGAPATFVSAANTGVVSGIASSDYDLDGIGDVAVGTFSTTGGANYVQLFRGRGDGTVLPPARIQVAWTPWWFRVVDLNRDHKPDLLVAHNLTGELEMFVNVSQ